MFGLDIKNPRPASPAGFIVTLILLSSLSLGVLLQCGRSSSNNQSSSSEPSTPSTADRADFNVNRPEGYKHGPREIKEKRTFTLTDTYTIGPIEEETHQLRAWLQVPLENRRQTVHEIRIDAGHLNFQITKDPQLGNRFLYFDIEHPSGPYEVVVNSRVTRHSIRAPYSSERPENATTFYVRETPGVPVNEKMKQLAVEQEATENNRKSMRRIYDYVVKQATYDEADPNKDDPSDTDDMNPTYGLVQKPGGCTDVPALLMSLSRTVQIPTRFVAGTFLPAEFEGRDRGVSSHCWAESYLNGQGWLPMDATFGDLWPDRYEFYFGQLDARRVAFSRGMDIELVPAASNDVRSFIDGHVELDGEEYENWNRKRTFDELE